jgi:regulator of protease activity HflC (stomatin/prohibitin superfamily)
MHGFDYRAVAGKRRDPPRWALTLMRRRGSRRLATLVGALLGLSLIVAVSGVKVAREDIGHVGVVRNGGPLDTRTIREILLPGQRLTYTGLFSDSPHEYPASHVTLKYTVTSRPTARPQPAVDTIVLPTKDGVQVGIDAAVFLRFIGEKDIATLKRFESSPGTRRFATPDGRRLYPWQGDDGFNALLDGLFKPVLENDLRKEVGRFLCASLVSSCALVQSAAVSEAPAPSVNVAEIERRINRSLERDLTRALGQHYFWDIRFRVDRVTLPLNVQKAVDDAQAQFAAVNSARAELKQAKYRAQRNRLLGDSYNRSPGLTTIEALRAVPRGSTVILSTGGKTPSILAGVGGAAGAGAAAGGSSSGGTDTASADTGDTDAGSTDAGGTASADTGDTGDTDAGTTDAGTSDTGTSDAGSTDAGTSDAGSTDAGSADSGADSGG